MGALVVDSNVIIAFMDPDDAHHQVADKTIRAEHSNGATFILPASVLAEVLVGQIRLNPSAVGQRLARLTRLFGPSRPIDEDVAVQAAQLRATNRYLRLPDAFVVATGIVDDADTVLTADRRLLAVDERVRLLA